MSPLGGGRKRATQPAPVGTPGSPHLRNQQRKDVSEMKRFLFVLFVLGMVSLMAAPISAKKGGNPGPPDDAPRVSVTCVSPWWADYETDDFDIVLTRDNPDACVDVLSAVAGKWVATVARGPNTLWRRPELMMVPRDAAWADWPSDSCGGIKRTGESVFGEWIFPPDDDRRGFDEIPAATVNACPGNDAVSLGGSGAGEWGELVERKGQDPEIVFERTPEQHPLAFVVWSHNLRKGESVLIHVDLPPLDE
jgi:hypothetical protein